MFNVLVSLVAAALLVPNALTQDTSGVPPCVLNCSVSSIAEGGCSSVADLPCICTSVPFQTAAGTCIATTCPDLAAQAVQIQNATCGPYLAGVNASSSVPGSASTAPPASSPGSSSGAAAPTSTTSTRSAGFHTAGIASGVTLALFGAAFSLF